MDYKHKIQDILRSEFVIWLEANKAIFGIAAIGLLIGKEELDRIIHDEYLINDRVSFEDEVKLIVSNQDEYKMEITEIALKFISALITGDVLTKITEIILAEDLMDIILHMEFWDNDMGMKELPISSITWLNSLVIEIFKLHKGKTIINVDSNTGDFILQLTEKMAIDKAIGYSYNWTSYEISKLRAYFVKSNINVYNTLFFTSITEEKYDMAYNSYPLLCKYENEDLDDMVSSWRVPFKISRKYSADLLWIINALQNVNQNGIVVALVANGVLFNDIDTDVRKYLVENNYISSIISLPTGILPFSGVATSLLILKKNNTNRHIRMIDATEICTKQRRYSIFSKEDIEKIINVYMDSNESDVAFNVSYEDVVENNYHLGIGRYVGMDCTLVNPCKLGSVVKSVFRGYQIKASEFDNISTTNAEDTEYRIINVADIQADGRVNKDLQAVMIEDTRKFDKYCVEDGDIIITAKNTTVKVGIYKGQENYKAILTGNLIAIRADEKKINPYYLKAFISSRVGEVMLKSIQTGTTVISISPNSIKDMKVSLPDMEKQNEIADEYIETLREIEEILNKYNKKYKHLKEVYDILI